MRPNKSSCWCWQGQIKFTIGNLCWNLLQMDFLSPHWILHFIHTNQMCSNVLRTFPNFSKLMIQINLKRIKSRPNNKDINIFKWERRSLTLYRMEETKPKLRNNLNNNNNEIHVQRSQVFYWPTTLTSPLTPLTPKSGLRSISYINQHT